MLLKGYQAAKKPHLSKWGGKELRSWICRCAMATRQEGDEVYDNHYFLNAKSTRARYL
jgi:hypothetical protein